MLKFMINQTFIIHSFDMRRPKPTLALSYAEKSLKHIGLTRRQIIILSLAPTCPGVGPDA